MVIKKCIRDVNICNTISTVSGYVADVDIRNILFFSLHGKAEIKNVFGVQEKGFGGVGRSSLIIWIFNLGWN